MTLILGLIGCAGSSPIVMPELGPAFSDNERDPTGTQARLDEFERICVKPHQERPPRRSEAPAWCAWTMQADKVIRANNAKVRGE